MTHPNQIPESKIALNPVVIDDSKRGSISTRCPIDEYAIIERLKEWELKAHNNAAKHPGFTKGREYQIEEKAYGRVINLIQNGRVRQAHHRLVPVPQERLGSD